MEKTCPDCERELRCVMTGADAYLAHTGDTHSSDLFMCFPCAEFYVYGLNRTPLVVWRDDPEKGRVKVVPVPDVVVAGDYLLIIYGTGFSWVAGGDVIPLPRALWYVAEKCGHSAEVARYLAKKGGAR